MALPNILEYPNPRLRIKAEAMTAADFTPELQQFIDSMFETMYQAPGIGLAATQVDFHKRMVIIDVSKDREEPLVFINPEIVWSSDEKATYEEGCLSIPEYYEEVERPKSVRVKFLDREGKPQEMEADGLLSTCLQHEIDHLNGVLFIDHISKLKRDMVLKKFKKAAKRGEPVKPLAEDDKPSHHIG